MPKKARPTIKQKKPAAGSAKSTNSTAIKKARFLKAFKAKGCNITKASEAAKIDRKTFYDWKSTDPEFAQATIDLEESDLDFTESQLQKQIRKGNLVAIIFKLKTKGKSRGYVERQDFGGHVNLSHQLSIADMKKSWEQYQNEAKG